MATGFSKTTFNNLGTAPAIDATFLNTLQDFLVAIANGGSGSVVKADDADAVSAAGIGVTSIPAMASDANNYKTGGIFYCASTITNAPFYGVKNANILVAPKDSNNVTQFAMSVDGSKAIKMRQCTSGTWTSWSDVGGGGSGAVNFLMNKLSENDLSSITNTGCTVTWDTTEDLSVAGSLKIDVAASGTGRKVEIDLSELSDAQITELCRLSFFYKLTVGADDNVEVYILNGSDRFNFDIIFLAANSGTLTKFDAAGMVTNRTGNKLVFGFKDNSAATMYLGDALLTPRVLPQGAVITEWQDYTPIFQGFGTPTSLLAQWRRVGSSCEIRCRFAAGTITAVEARISLPNSLVTAGSGNGFYAGQALRGATSSSLTTYYVIGSPGLPYLNFSSASATKHGYVNDLATAILANGDWFTFFASVPISGWTSSINLVTEAQEFAFNTQATINTNDTTSFGYGPGGTPILANTAITYYDVQFKSDIQPSDNIILEVRSKSGAWIDSARCSGASFCGLAPGWNASSDYGVGINQVGSKVVRVRFNSFASIQAGTARTWATMIAYSDGFDRWRVRKISNGNMAEAPASGIYESGQNANGYYVKYVDGTMVQWGVETITAYPHTKTLPVAFADTNWAFASTRGYVSPAAFVMLGSTKTSQACDLYCVTHSGGTISSGVVEWHAIGKWNLSLSVAAPGTPVGASTVLAHYRQSSAYAVGSLQPYDYDELIEDSLGCVTIGSSWKFTAPVSGLYLVTATIPIGASTYSALYKNGALAQQFGVFGANTAMNACPVSAVIRLAQGDYIDMRSTYTGSISSPDRFIQITRLSA